MGSFVKVDAAYTSQRCAECGVIDARSRIDQATFVCVACPHTDNADVNSARYVPQEHLLSCTMVITELNDFVAEVHDGMPVILEAKDFKQWDCGDAKDVAALMKPAGEHVLQKWPVSKRVNSARAPDDDARLIKPIGTAGEAAPQAKTIRLAVQA